VKDEDEDDGGTVAERLEAEFRRLTRAERQLAASLLENYPVSGLRAITAVARDAGVSTPTVARLVQKLGYPGFGAFQEALRRELAARIQNPLDKLGAHGPAATETRPLERIAKAAVTNMRQTLARTDHDAFEEACRLLADPARRILTVGGRFTGTLAGYLARHLQVTRPGVTDLGGDPNLWPQALLDLEAGDILVVFDIRRYQRRLGRLAEAAAAEGAHVILFTDQWGSPISAIAGHRFHARIEAPSAWDSGIALMLLVEAVIARVQELVGEDAVARIDRLEALFRDTRTFGRED